ncbi:MAG: thioredoxin family protein [Verrucomicrobiota bacterium]
MKFLLSACIAVIMASTGIAGEGWLTDYEKALAQAKNEDKKLLMDFTGSDWCGWCIRLDKEVFSKDEFKKYAAENLVLLEVDFPNKKKQSAEQKKANDALAKKYGIRGFPTIIVLDGKEKKLGQLGYMEGGPKAFINALKKL